MADVAARTGLPFAALAPDTVSDAGRASRRRARCPQPPRRLGSGGRHRGAVHRLPDRRGRDVGVDVVALAVDLVEEYDGDESYPRAVRAAAMATRQADGGALARARRRGPGPGSARCAAPASRCWKGSGRGCARSGHLRAHAEGGLVRTVEATPEGRPGRRGCPRASERRSRSPCWRSSVSRSCPRWVPRTCGTAVGGRRAARATRWSSRPTSPGIEHRARVGGVLARTSTTRPRSRRRTPRWRPAADRGSSCSRMRPDGARWRSGVVADPALGPILMLAVGGTPDRGAGPAGCSFCRRWTRPAAERLVARFAALAARGRRPAGVAAGRVDGGEPARDRARATALVALDVNPLLITAAGACRRRCAGAGRSARDLGEGQRDRVGRERGAAVRRRSGPGPRVRGVDHVGGAA